MKLWKLTTLCTVSLLILSGCGATPKPQEKALIDGTLPMVELTKSGIYADINAIAFEWKSIKDPRVLGIYVYKKSPSIDGVPKRHIYYETINNRFATHYVDNDIKANTKYSYAFKTFSNDAESRLTTAIYAKSLPTLDSVSWIHSINGMPRTAKVIWRPHSNQKVKSYIIERKMSQNEEFEEIARVDGRLNVEYIDTDLKDNKVYEYRVKVLTFDGLISSASRSVSVVTKALPKSVHSISASSNLPREIRLKWNKSQAKDFSLYYVYRAQEIDGDYKLIAKLINNTHIDKLAEDAKDYFYRVSVVDKDGLESNSESTTVKGSTLGKPKSPTSVRATLLGTKVEITWSNSDERTKKFLVTKKEKTGWLKEKSTQYNVDGHQKFIDLNVKAGSTYIYKIYAVDDNSIVSEPSSPVKITIPESTKVLVAEPVKEEVKSVVSPTEVIEVQGETIIPNKDLNLNEI